MCDGVTTNPSLIAAQGKAYLPAVKEIAQLVGDRPVSGGDTSARIVVPGDTVEFLPPFAGG
jgi:transaldolase